jgi:hypothetical protein
MLNAVDYTIVGFDYDSDNTKTCKDVLGHMDHMRWGESMNVDVNAMETKFVKETGELLTVPLGIQMA